MKKTLLLPCLLATSLLAAAPAGAHDLWILPSATTFSGETAWVTFDAAVGNDKFYFNHRPLGLEGVVIEAPSGQRVEPSNPFKGELRSGFDLKLADAGTYRVALVRDGVSAQWREDGKPRRWFGTADAYAANVPANAQDLKVEERATRIETFVTKGGPTDVRLVNHGLALAGETHPNDLYSGETARFVLMLDGKPLPDTEVEIVPEGSRYRDSVNDITVSTDAQGRFDMTWPAPGRYWLHAEHRGPAAGGKTPAGERLSAYAATLEVLP